MKLLSNFKSGLLKAMVAAFAICPAAVSCYDDSALREQDSALQDQIDILIDKVYELETRLSGEIEALQAMLRGKALITDVSTNASTGITTITLSTGSTLQLLPEKDLESFITYITLGDGQNYWAYLDGEGNKQLFLDKDEKPVPVMTETPEVVEIDGDTYLVIGGVQYPLSGNSVFSDYELITDELTGEVYAVTFTFGEDMTFTVTVDGACGFYFVQQSGWSTSIVSDWYVANGVTERVQVEARGVVDYVLQIPDGWRVKEYKDVFMGALYFDITAPAAELVESGVAAAEGDLKVVAVLEGGKATVARLYLSTKPFKTFGVSLGNVTAEMYNGLQKFVYGVCTEAEYDEAAIFQTAQGLLEAYDYPAGYGLSTNNLNVPVSEVLAQDPVAGESYVFWALPAIYYQTNEDAGYYLAEGTFVKVPFKYSSVKFEVSDEKFRDATLSMNIVGAEGYYMEVLPASDFLLEDVVYLLNYSSDPITEPMTYEGSIFELAGLTAEPATDYVAWIALAEEGKTYTEADVIVCEFSTLKLEAGGAVKVEAGEAQATALDVIVPLTAEGAETLYYTFMTTSDAKKYDDDQTRASYLLENGVSVDATSAEARLTDVISKTKPSTEYVLMAVASDKEGKYGEVLVANYKTTEVVYNDLEVKLELLANDPGDVVISVDCEGAEGFLYWIGKTSDNTWKSSNYLGGSAETAQAYMYLNPTHSRLTDVMSKYPVVDGLMTLTDLSMGVDHVLVIMAKAADGTYSKAYELRFKTRAVAIGTIVTSDDSKWAAAEPVIDFIEEAFAPAAGMMSGQYAVDVTIPAGFTGYVLLGTDAYFSEGETDVALSVEEKILSVIEFADAKRDVGILIDEDAWVTLGYPYGYEFYHFPHGSPSWGNRPGAAVIWSSEEFHASRCHCIETVEPTKIINGVEMPIQHVILINDGNPVRFTQPSAIGSTTEVIDRVFIVCQDAEGNCYQTYEYDVPVELFVNAVPKE
ncbi:MAG: hypothetical protein IKA13_04355 [Bacteroidales bacterium]|nr:hypothetical protein [Bacteroidales bacterium]